MDRLRRETNPPSGQLASPVPQYKDVITGEFEELQGEGGASYVKDRDALAQLQQVKADLALVKADLAVVRQQLAEGSAKVALTGTKVVESAPVTGIKTVTSTVAEVFAGSSRKSNRSKLVIRNLHQAVAIRIGGSNITDTIGQSLEPGASVEIDFSPSTTVPIYAVSTAGNVSVEVLEV